MRHSLRHPYVLTRHPTVSGPPNQRSTSVLDYNVNYDESNSSIHFPDSIIFLNFAVLFNYGAQVFVISFLMTTTAVNRHMLRRFVCFVQNFRFSSSSLIPAGMAQRNASVTLRLWLFRQGSARFPWSIHHPVVIACLINWSKICQEVQMILIELSCIFFIFVRHCTVMPNFASLGLPKDSMIHHHLFAYSCYDRRY